MHYFAAHHVGSSLPGAQKNISWEVQRYDGWYNNLQHHSRGSVGACQGWDGSGGWGQVICFDKGTERESLSHSSLSPGRSLDAPGSHVGLDQGRAELCSVGLFKMSEAGGHGCSQLMIRDRRAGKKTSLETDL